MKDSYNRQICYMRLSVTDKCNFNCSYCKSGVDKQKRELLSFDELYNICVEAVNCGISKIRITGGEPLVRSGIIDFCKKVSNISGLNELTMTTNGSLLKYYASQLKSAGVSRLNISLDTLNPTRFNLITSTESYNEVLEGIKEAQKCGFKGIKINCVLIGGFNDDEIKDFVSLTKDNDIVVRFIELMPIGESANWQSDKFVSNEKVLQTVPELKMQSFDGVAQMYKVDGYKGYVGLIRPMSDKFCGVCNRIRVTSDGKIKPCLHSKDEFDLRGLVGSDLKDMIEKAILSKPQSHSLEHTCCSNSTRFMNEIGG